MVSQTMHWGLIKIPNLLLSSKLSWVKLQNILWMEMKKEQNTFKIWSYKNLALITLKRQLLETGEQNKQ